MIPEATRVWISANLPTAQPWEARLQVNQSAMCHLQSCCLVEVGGADALADNVPLCPRGNQWELLLVHDILQLLTHLSNLHNQPTTSNQEVKLRQCSRFVFRGLPKELTKVPRNMAQLYTFLIALT